MKTKKLLSFLLALLLIFSPLAPLAYAEETGEESLKEDVSEEKINEENSTKVEIDLEAEDEQAEDEQVANLQVENEQIENLQAEDEQAEDEQAEDEQAENLQAEDNDEDKEELLTSSSPPVVMRMIIPVEATKSFRFYNSETDAISGTGMKLEQIIRNNEVLQEPSSPQKVEGKIFIGWFYMDGSVEKQIVFNSQGQSDPIAVDEGQVPSEKIINVYAKYEDSYSVHFIYNGEVLLTKEVASAETFDDEDVIYFIEDEELSFKWWSEVEGGGKFTLPNSVNKDTNLYLVTKPSFKVSFNTMGGSPILPIYVDQGEALGNIPEPTRAGYDFDGWEDMDGNSYMVNTLVTAPVELFAQWSPKNVAYSIVYFLENAEDNGYTYEKTVVKTGPTASTTNVNASLAGAINHFSFSHADDEEIKGDGSTIVRVYYSRNKYTLTFRKPSGYSGYTDAIAPVQVKHGAKTNQWWDLADNATNKAYGWRENSTSGSRNVEAPLMHKKNLTFYGVSSGSSNMRVVFMEIGSPNNLLIKNVDFTGSTNNTFNGGRLVTGFTWKYVTKPGTDRDIYRYNYSSQKYEVKSYYERNEYQLDFLTNSNHSVPAKTVLYEGSLAGAVPTELMLGDVKTLSGLDYKFAGWYKDPAFTDLFNFATETMPAHNVELHGKWIPKKHTVRYYDGIEGELLGSFEIDHGEKILDTPISLYTSPPNFKGWYRKDGNKFIPFVLEEETVLMDMDLYPIFSGQTQEVFYKDSLGEVIDHHDVNQYTSRAKAIVKDYPEDDEGGLFVGWHLDGDSSGKIYYAGHSILMNSNKTFTPVFREPLDKTKIFYNAGDGQGNEKSYDVLINSKHVIKNYDDGELNFNRPGYEFTGWKVEGNLHQPGEEHLVDDSGVGSGDYAANTFVAQWRRSAEDIRATKEWSGGESVRPNIVTLILLRNEVEQERVDVGETQNWSYVWQNQPIYDDDGEPYSYSVDEVDVPNFDKTFDGNTITNTYVIPEDGSYTAQKNWEGDEAVTRPVMIFDLYRKVGSVDEKVPGADRKEVDGETVSATWTGLQTSNERGEAYSFYVRESFKEGNILNDNWVLGEDENGSVLNRVITEEEKQGQLTVGKELLEQIFDSEVLGGSTQQVSFSFILTGPYGFEEEFELYAGQEKTFTDLYYGSYLLEEIDSAGYRASYSQDEIVLTKENPQGEISVENTHQVEEETGADSNLVEVEARKIWIKGPASDHTAVEMILSRSTGGEKELVSAIARVSEEEGSFHYLWEGLDKHSPEGYEYIYSVEEEGVVDGKITLEDRVYTVIQDGNTITNTYVIQKTDIAAKKVWIDAPNDKPNIWFKLYRKTDDGKLEEVPGAEIQKVINEKALWKEVDKTDMDGNHYTFSVKEVDKNGKDFVPENYTKKEEGLIVKNNYTKPLEKLPSTGEGSLNMLLFAGFSLLGSGTLLLFKKRR